MHFTVLGAGVVGVASAWFLAAAGHRVTVLDRQPAPGLETSFANGGQLSFSHAEPWANPQAPGQMLRWLGRAEAPLRFRPRADLAQWAWGAAFLRECLPGRTRANTRAVYALARASREALAGLRAETGIAFQAEERGILHLHFSAAEHARAREGARLLEGLGCHYRPLDRAACLALEPALARAPGIAGGVHFSDDASGDAHLFTRALATLAAARGVEFRHGVTVRGLRADGGRVTALELDGGEALAVDNVVASAGSWSRDLLAPLGVRLPVYPVKGYSITLPVADEAAAPRVSVTDEGRRIVFSRLGDRLRAAGTAELGSRDTAVDPARAGAILRRTLELFPGAGDPSKAETWAGLRPATPGNVPCVGATAYPNLWLNTGHGTLGWTLACGSARALADIVAGRDPGVDFPFRRA